MSMKRRQRSVNLLLVYKCMCMCVSVGNLFARCLCSEHFELTVPRVVTVIVYS